VQAPGADEGADGACRLEGRGCARQAQGDQSHRLAWNEAATEAHGPWLFGRPAAVEGTEAACGSRPRIGQAGWPSAARLSASHRPSRLGRQPFGQRAGASGRCLLAGEGPREPPKAESSDREPRIWWRTPFAVRRLVCSAICWFGGWGAGRLGRSVARRLRGKGRKKDGRSAVRCKLSRGPPCRGRGRGFAGACGLRKERTAFSRATIPLR